MNISIFNFLLLLGILLWSVSSNSQESLEFLNDSKVSMKWNSKDLWFYKFTIGNRNILKENEKSVFKVLHIEFTQFTYYKVGLNDKIGLGIRYRFGEIFERNYENELRFIQEFNRKSNWRHKLLSHRFRIEERFRKRKTLRNRYQLQLEFPIKFLRSKTYNNSSYGVITTEALWSLGKKERPSLEQRIGFNFGNSFIRNTKSELGFQYRLKDYTGNTRTALFFYTKLSISI